MNRLPFVVSEIDTDLKEHYFKSVKFWGLCEQEERNEKLIPVFNRGYGEEEFAGFEDTNGLNIYHRLIEYDHVEDTELGFARTSQVNETYSMVTILFGNQRMIIDGNNNITYKIADEFRSLYTRKLSKAQLTALAAQTGLIQVTGTNHNKQAVWGSELPDTDFKISPETLLASITYTISLQYCGEFIPSKLAV